MLYRNKAVGMRTEIQKKVCLMNTVYIECWIKANLLSKLHKYLCDLQVTVL